jgi:hypothetical protein
MRLICLTEIPDSAFELQPGTPNTVTHASRILSQRTEQQPGVYSLCTGRVLGTLRDTYLVPHGFGGGEGQFIQAKCITPIGWYLWQELAKVGANETNYDALARARMRWCQQVRPV